MLRCKFKRFIKSAEGNCIESKEFDGVVYQWVVAEDRIRAVCADTQGQIYTPLATDVTIVY